MGMKSYNNAVQQKTKFMAFIFLILLSLGRVDLGARIELPAHEVQKIVLQAGVARVKFVAGNTKMLLVQGVYEGDADSHYVAEKRGNELHIHLKEPISSWSQLSLKRSGGEKANLTELIISHPTGVPFVLSLEGGSVEVSSWKGDKEIYLIDGKILASKSQGALKVFGQYVNLQGQEIRGEIEGSIYRGQIFLDQIVGDGRWRQGVGTFELQKSSGRWQIEGVETSYKISNSQMDVRFNIEKGLMSLLESSGRVEGFSGDGPVILSEAKGGLDVQVSTQSAAVKCSVQSLNSKKIRLKTQKGDLVLPQGYKIQRGLSEKTFRQEADEDKESGKVSIQSNEGSVYLR